MSTSLTIELAVYAAVCAAFIGFVIYKIIKP